MATYDLGLILDRVLNMQDAVRVGVCGAHGVGKTTLSKKIAKEVNLLYIPEYARCLIKVPDFDWVASNLLDATNFERAVYSCYAFTLSFINRQHKSYISDRTLIDVAAYCLWHISRGENLEQSESMLKLYNEIINYTKNNDFWDIIIFYTTDGLKPDSCQIFIEGAINSLIYRCFYNKEVIKVKRGDKILLSENTIIEV